MVNSAHNNERILFPAIERSQWQGIVYWDSFCLIT